MNPISKVKAIVVRLTILVAFTFLLLSCNKAHNIITSFITHPNDLSKKVEHIIKQPIGRGAFPAIILIHGHQIGLKPGGGDFVDWGKIPY